MMKLLASQRKFCLEVPRFARLRERVCKRGLKVSVDADKEEEIYHNL